LLDRLRVFDPAAECDEVGIVVLFCHARSVAVVNEGAADSLVPVGRDRDADARSAAHDAEIIAALEIFLHGQLCLVRIIDPVLRVDAEIDDLVTLALQPCHKTKFQRHRAVIICDEDFHRPRVTTKTARVKVCPGVGSPPSRFNVGESKELLFRKFQHSNRHDLEESG